MQSLPTSKCENPSISLMQEFASPKPATRAKHGFDLPTWHHHNRPDHDAGGTPGIRAAYDERCIRHRAQDAVRRA